MRRTVKDVEQVIRCIQQSCDDGLLIIQLLEEQRVEDEARQRRADQRARVRGITVQGIEWRAGTSE